MNPVCIISRIIRYQLLDILETCLKEIFPERRLKHWLTWLKIKTQLFKKNIKVMVLSFLTEVTVSKLSKFLEDTSRFNGVNIE